jgi:Na+/H+ antiporter NhaD/arsenite permease-like protein
MALRLKGNLKANTVSNHQDHQEVDIPFRERKIVLGMGLGALLFVPVFKTVTHLPPFMGVLLGLSILWATTEIMHKRKEDETKVALSISSVLKRVDTSSILFFLGILLAVAALQTSGMLNSFAQFLDTNIANVWIINILIGFLSSVVDNVPLVAGAIGMYDLSLYPQDDLFWELLAFCAGTGGSSLIIGSAAGVAIMGILRIDFMWYLKNISLLAVIGYLSGVAAFWLMNYLV